MVESFHTRTLPYYAPRGPSIRRILAGILRAASHRLARLSRSLSASERTRNRTQSEAVYEFYAEAGAPEGAFYVDGKLVCYVKGVTRL